MSCRSCNMTCRSLECFVRHTERKQTKQGVTLSACEKRYQCKICKKTLYRKERPPNVHECGEWKCPCCHEFHTNEHLCYQRAIQDQVTDKKMIFFDCETTQDSILQCEEGYKREVMRCDTCAGAAEECRKCKLCQNCQKSWCGSNEHRVNFVCMQTACNLCKDQKITDDPKCTNCGVRCSSCCQMDGSKFKKDPCPSTCGFRERLFKGTRAAVSFCETVFTEQYKNGIVMSHNGSGYDNYFLIEWMISNSIRPQVVFNGSKIVYMLVQRGLHIRVLDSLQFLPMKLAKLPKAFGLTELKKGYFPHFFNTTEHQNYVGPYPDVKYYGCDYMNTEDRTDFLAWYEGKKDAVFDFAQEMKEYCCSDVTILREGMLKFRDLVLDVTGANDQQGVDVLNYVTIAGLTMAIYKSKFLREEFDIEITNQQNEHSERIRHLGRGCLDVCRHLPD